MAIIWKSSMRKPQLGLRVRKGLLASAKFSARPRTPVLDEGGLTSAQSLRDQLSLDDPSRSYVPRRVSRSGNLDGPRCACWPPTGTTIHALHIGQNGIRSISYRASTIPKHSARSCGGPRTTETDPGQPGIRRIRPYDALPPPCCWRDACRTRGG